MSVIRPTTVVSLANLMMVLESYLAMQSWANGVLEETEYAPLRVPRVEDQRGRCVVTYSYHREVARQEVQDPVAEGV